MVLCGAGLPPPPDEEFVGGVLFWTVTATGGLKWAHSMPSDNGSVDILGPDCDWLDGGSCCGPLLAHPGKGGKIPKSPAGRLAMVGATSPVRTRSQPPVRLNVMLLTSRRWADLDEPVGDASSKCKEAGGAQDRIIHTGNDDEDGGSCRDPLLVHPGKGWGGEGLLCHA